MIQIGSKQYRVAEGDAVEFNQFLTVAKGTIFNLAGK